MSTGTRARGDASARRDSYLAALRRAIQGNSRIRAAWIEGSLGRGQADRFSDIDLHLLMAEADLPRFREEAETWLAEIRPLVLFNQLFNGQMINALTHDGVRLDLWSHAGETVQVNPDRIQVLHETPGSLQKRQTTSAPDPAASARQALAQTREFWRCMTLLPAVIGRDERLVALNGLLVEMNLVVELLLLRTGVVRDRGVKNLKAYLSPEARVQLERAVTLADLSPQALIDAHLTLAAMVRVEGPALAHQFGYAYPQELEYTALEYVRDELLTLGYRVPDFGAK